MIIRWICEKDNKKWVYPIKKCIYCKGPITKQKSIKANVIGITKVNIPSLMHPLVPYNIILVEDEYGNRMPKKTMKQYKIGDIYQLKPAETDGAVIITKVKYDIKEYLEETLSLLHNYAVDPEDKILIKPDILEPAYGYQAVTTNPKILDALIFYLKEKGVKDIIVAEQSIMGTDTLIAAKKSGILDVCKSHGVNFVDLRRFDYIEKEAEGFKFKIAKEFFNRKIINAPVMKTNSQITISGAIENMLRATDEDTQKRMFAEDIDKTLPKLLRALPNFLSIGDATIGLQGQGPTALGEPAFLNMVFASKDPVALDTVFIKMSSLQMPEYIKEAARLGIGNNDTKNIEIIGDELEAVITHLHPAEKSVSGHPKVKLVDGKADPYTFNSALKITSKLMGISGEEISLAIGSQITKDMVAGKKRLIAYGKDSIDKLKELSISPLAEIPTDIDDFEKIILLKDILENPNKEKITVGDKIKSKMLKLGGKLRGAF